MLRSWLSNVTLNMLLMHLDATFLTFSSTCSWCYALDFLMSLLNMLLMRLDAMIFNVLCNFQHALDISWCILVLRPWLSHVSSNTLLVLRSQLSNVTLNMLLMRLDATFLIKTFYRIESTASAMHHGSMYLCMSEHEANQVQRVLVQISQGPRIDPRALGTFK